MNLVVNEWLPDYFLRKASLEEKQLLQNFLNRFMARGDVLYVQVSSPFEAKIYKFAKDNQQYPIYQNIKQFIANILENSSRCVRITQKCELPKVINELLSVGNYESDRYLFETAWQLPENETKIIITTDGKLKTQMDNNGYFEVILLKDFLKTY